MKNKFSVIFIFLAFMMVIASYKVTTSFALEKEVSNNFESKSAYLVDFDSGSVISKKNECERLPIASMCKIMTLLLCFDEIESDTIALDDVICISENASGMGGSQIYLEENGKYTINELIKGIVVASANDACVAMAEHICGSEQEFVLKMNNKATELGMNDTVFTNCTGLPKPGQYSCAKDVAKMFSELIKHEKYFDYSGIWMDKINHSKERITEISNTNKLIKFYNGCDSGKTGYTSEAGHCICASAKRDNMRLISVVIGAPNSKTRFKEASDMFNYGFANFTNKLIIDNAKPIDECISVKGGNTNTVKCIPEKPVYIFTNKNEKRSFEFDVVKNTNLKAPISKGDVVGELVVYENGIEVTSVNLISLDAVKKANYFDNVKNIIEDMGLIG